MFLVFLARSMGTRRATPHSFHPPTATSPTPQAPSSSSDLSEDVDARRPKLARTTPQLSTGSHSRSPHKRIHTQPPTHQASGRCPRTSSPRRRIITVARPVGNGFWLCKGDWMGEHTCKVPACQSFSVPTLFFSRCLACFGSASNHLTARELGRLETLCLSAC